MTNSNTAHIQTSISDSEAGAHILVFPFPAQGHMIPLLDLTHHLAIRGLTITILFTPDNHSQLNPLLSAHPSITPLVLPLVEKTAIPARGFHGMFRAVGDFYSPLLHWFRNHPSPPLAIISDMFLGWTHNLACELNIPRYYFCPSGAFAVTLFNFLWCEMPKRKNVDTVDEMVEFTHIPNSPVYPWWQLSQLYRSYVEGDPISEFIKDSFLSNLASSVVVLNTFSELEEIYLNYLVKELGHDRVWSVGPLLPPDEVGPANRGRSSFVSTGEISTWLDACEDHTVVYACFGSRAVLTNRQIEELALGLEKSGVKFVLSLKDATKGHMDEGGDYGVIPPGLKDRVAGRGLVIEGWAPQVLILRHKAVGAFLTHCGWNSTLESIIAGVPMLAWPMGADQFNNATLIVDQLNVGIKVCEGNENVLHSDILARFFAETTSEKWGEKRARALELSKAASDAITEGGSSFKNLDRFVSHLFK